MQRFVASRERTSTSTRPSNLEVPLYEPLDESEESLESELPKSSDAPETSSGLDASEHFSEEARQERMQAAMFDVMAGAVARGRSLKYWENLRLKPVHMQMLLMKAAGFTGKAIAEKLDYDQGRVSVIVNHPDAMYLLSHLVSFQAETLLDVNARIAAHSGEALDTALMLLRNGKEEVREKVAFKLLDRAGYGAVKKIEATHKFEMPAAQASALTAALRESDEVEDMEDADFQVLENGPAGGSGSPEESELLDRVAPPNEDQQEPVSSTELIRRTA